MLFLQKTVKLVTPTIAKAFLTGLEKKQLDLTDFRTRVRTRLVDMFFLFIKCNVSTVALVEILFGG